MRGTLLCTPCMSNIPHATKPNDPHIHALFSYQSPIVKDAVWRFKYKNVRGFAEVFAPVLQNEIIEALAERLLVSQHEKPVLVPIPLHRKRLTERGYNQSELLARAIMKLSDEQMFEYAPNALTRTRATRPQARSDTRKTRLENLKDAFETAYPTLVYARIVVLIDDVTTTGATLSEARKVLLAAGARDVIAFTLAH